MSKIDRSSPAGASARPEPEFFSLQISEAKRFFIPSHDPKPILHVIGGGVERCSREYHVHREGFPYVGIEFVARGTGELKLGRKSHRLMPGMIFCYDSTVSQDIRSTASDPLVKYFVDVVGETVPELLQTARLKVGAGMFTVSPQSVLALFDEMIRSGLETSAHAPDACAALFRALMFRLADTHVTSPTKVTPAFDTYLHCRRELHRSATQVRNLEELATRCGVNVAYLCRLFKRFDHSSPYQQLRRLKMEHAARRLAEGDVLVKQVAAEMGFNDAFTFSKAFRATLGRSPSEARRHE